MGGSLVEARVVESTVVVLLWETAMCIVVSIGSVPTCLLLLFTVVFRYYYSWVMRVSFTSIFPKKYSGPVSVLLEASTEKSSQTLYIAMC